MKICFISDTHTFEDKIKLPECDILVHSGDYTFTGTIPEVNKFMVWFSEQEATHLICVNGNHERQFQQNPDLFKNLIPSNVTYLQDKAVNLEGLNFYGSPHTKAFGEWAYMYYTVGEAEAIWSRIPTNTDILVTHMPPYGIRDGAPYKLGEGGICVPSLDEDGESVGCEVLREKVREINPLIHSFGHIHEGFGYTQTEHTLFINASICTGQYKPTNTPIVVEVDVKSKKVLSVV